MVGWEPVAELDVTDASFSRVWNGRSGWSAKAPFDQGVWDLCQTDGVQATGLGVVVYQDGHQWVGVMGDGYPLLVDGETLEFAGISLLSCLGWRVPAPNPAAPWTAGGNEFWTATGSRAGVWTQLNAQCGTTAFANRRLQPDWSFTAITSGPTSQISARWSPTLLELVETVGRGHEVVFDPLLVQLPDPHVVCDIKYLPDSGDPVAVLSPDLGDVESWRVGTSRNWRPWTVAGGKGEGASRPLASAAGGGEAGWEHREEWLEAADADTNDLLTQRRTARNAERMQQAGQPLELVLSGSGQTVFGRDFAVGDIVLVDVPRLAMVKARVLEATTTVRGAQVSTRVVVGSGVFDARMVPNHQVRIGRLEGR